MVRATLFRKDRRIRSRFTLEMVDIRMWRIIESDVISGERARLHFVYFLLVIFITLVPIIKYDAKVIKT